jgi:hypothetical protein
VGLIFVDEYQCTDKLHSGNFDDECHPCMIDKDEDRDGLFLKCNCLNNEGIPQYTFIGMGPGGE